MLNLDGRGMQANYCAQFGQCSRNFLDELLLPNLQIENVEVLAR